MVNPQFAILQSSPNDANGNKSNKSRQNNKKINHFFFLLGCGACPKQRCESAAPTDLPFLLVIFCFPPSFRVALLFAASNIRAWMGNLCTYV